MYSYFPVQATCFTLSILLDVISVAYSSTVSSYSIWFQTIGWRMNCKGFGRKRPASSRYSPNIHLEGLSKALSPAFTWRGQEKTRKRQHSWCPCQHTARELWTQSLCKFLYIEILSPQHLLTFNVCQEQSLTIATRTFRPSSALLISQSCWDVQSSTSSGFWEYHMTALPATVAQRNGTFRCNIPFKRFDGSRA
jgi:hypothetical protein